MYSGRDLLKFRRNPLAHSFTLKMEQQVSPKCRYVCNEVGGVTIQVTAFFCRRRRHNLECRFIQLVKVFRKEKYTVIYTPNDSTGLLS